MNNNELDYNELRRLGYGDNPIYDDEGNILDRFCTHYYDSYGECVFCGSIKFGSFYYNQLYDYEE